MENKLSQTIKDIREPKLQEENKDMKKLPVREVIEVEDEGLVSLLGEQVILFCMNYFYAGKLVGVNDSCVLLENGSIVYETGPFTDAKWKDAQKVADKLYVKLDTIESFAKGK